MEYSPKSEHNEKDRQQDTDIGMVAEQPVAKRECHEPEEDSNTDSIIALDDTDTDQGKSASVVTETETGVPSMPVFQPIPPFGFGAIHPYFWPPVAQPNHYQDVWRSRPVLPSIPTRPLEAVGQAPKEFDENLKNSDSVKPITILSELTDPVSSSSTADRGTPLPGVVKVPHLHTTQESQ